MATALTPHPRRDGKRSALQIRIQIWLMTLPWFQITYS
jgi:hypothetical protein